MLNPEEKRHFADYRPGQEDDSGDSSGSDGPPVLKTVQPFKLYVRNVGVDLNEDAIRNIFEKFGRVFNIYLGKSIFNYNKIWFSFMKCD